MVVGEKNVITEILVDRDKIILPPLHIKLVLMKLFVKGATLITYAENFQC